MGGHHDPGPGWLTAAVVFTAAAGYLTLAVAAGRRGTGWPVRHTILWVAGLVIAAAAVSRPGHGFRDHMISHVLLGMVAPVALVLAAPVTLTLRALPVAAARRMARLLRCHPARFVAHPVTAAVLNTGGLWLLYTTDLYRYSTADPAVALLIHAHVLLSGYLFTAAMIGVDPAPHRPGRATRGVVLIASLALHDILAKHLWTHPPAGVPQAGAQAGAELMYYRGDLADLLLVVVFCAQWYHAAGRRDRVSGSVAGPPPSPARPGR
ncbi:cytochrome c oxidase assembly protein [Actinoplanes couchii]|uniref:Membrane protein n=1 Tax=Actinoplanes couchii TaxID=403638 RepID=A0ABQ3XN90_9ACTN|nr:cytochrome c oxidase assembly protein [Actinoplanes couchii]MDR6318100.1 putative membrane protein [Actinoplanes couchii]GID59984.1 membrane protein [Actinoplanes couchii]